MNEFNQTANNYSGTQNNYQLIVENLQPEILDMFRKNFEEHTQNIKITDAYFREKNVQKEKYTQFYRSKKITSDDRKIVGEFESPVTYMYAGLGTILFSSNIKKIRGAKLIYSRDDEYEQLDDVLSLAKSLEVEKLRKKTKKGAVCFQSDCQLIYNSSSEKRIKNFLVFIDGGGKGYDLFVVQTVQTPVAEGVTKYEINEAHEIANFSIKVTPRNKLDKFKMTSRVVLLNDLEKMLEPISHSSGSIEVGNETKLFKEFVEQFNSAYNFNLIEMEEQ